MTREELGQRIAQERQRARMTQEQLAAAIDLERTAVTRIEQGKQGVDTLQLAAIAEALGRPIAAFFETADADPIAVLLRAPEGANAEVHRHVMWVEGFVRDYAFLRRLAAQPSA